MFPLIQIGPLAIPAAPLLLLASIWIGLSVIERYSAKFNIYQDQVYNLVFAGLLAGILGARLAYAARFPNVFLEDPLALLTLKPVMFDTQGGFIIGIAASLIYQQNRKLPFLRTLDSLTIGLAVFFIGLGMAHLASGDAFGASSQIPWRIWLWGEYRHPAQVYEILGGLVVLLTIIREMKSERIHIEGYVFFSFAAYTSGLRLFLEAFRGDSILIFSHVRAMQVLYWLILAASLWMMNRRLNAAEEGEAA